MLLISDEYDLTIRQGPERARVAGSKERDRKPVDPPPIIQLRVRDPQDPSQNYLQSPYFFMLCNLWDVSEDHAAQTASLAGTQVSSLHRLKDIDNTDGGFFVFGDLSIKIEGEFRLRFSLFEMRKTQVVYIKSTVSKSFTVFASKSFPGMSESTFLSRSFGDQGVRLRIRKEPRTLVKRQASQAFRSDEFPRPFVPPLRQDPLSPAGQLQFVQTGGYGGTPTSDTSLGFGEPSAKRRRTSLDVKQEPSYRAPGYAESPIGYQVNAVQNQFTANFNNTYDFSFRPPPATASSTYVPTVSQAPVYQSMLPSQINTRDPRYSQYQQPQYSPLQHTQSTQTSSLAQPSPRPYQNPSDQTYAGTALSAYQPQRANEVSTTIPSHQRAPSYDQPNLYGYRNPLAGQNLMQGSSGIPQDRQDQTYQSTPNVLPPLSSNIISSTLPSSNPQSENIYTENRGYGQLASPVNLGGQGVRQSVDPHTGFYTPSLKRQRDPG
ncbi:hypothetical protein MMC09_006474 [Bachmanniomyces sp. S44760]|nr:hypothetical protein [Bachmanniomyces sp. S44760]